MPPSTSHQAAARVLGAHNALSTPRRFNFQAPGSNLDKVFFFLMRATLLAAPLPQVLQVCRASCAPLLPLPLASLFFSVASPLFTPFWAATATLCHVLLPLPLLSFSLLLLLLLLLLQLLRYLLFHCLFLHRPQLIPHPSIQLSPLSPPCV